MENTVAFVASSLEEAEKFIKQNKDFSHAPKWWWAVYPMLVDTDDIIDEIHFYDREGRRLNNQDTKESKMKSVEVITKENYTLVKTSAALGSAIAAGILELSPLASVKTTVRIPLLYNVKLPDNREIEIAPHIVKVNDRVFRVSSNAKQVMLTELEDAELIPVKQKSIDLSDANVVRVCVFRDSEKGPTDWFIDVKNKNLVKIVNRWMFVA